MAKPTTRRIAVFVAAVLCVVPLSSCAGETTPVAGSRAGAVTPQQAAQIDDGRTVAERNCASCHAIGSMGESPNPRAPLFRTVLSRYDAGMLSTELIVGIRVAHAPMPQFQFNPAAADALISYMRSIQTRDPGRQLVEQRCSQCHAIDQTSTSPYPGAQPFRKLGQRWRRGQLRDALKTGIIVEHDKADARVPPMKLNDAEIDALLTFLDLIATDEYPAPRTP
ncbi:MAG: cytochrome c [Alphaproteobacteria bacterium]|nr:cytochrome c [Alphaproteobacteria bacterium]